MLTDKEAIIKIKKGELDNFSFIVNKYTPLIYRYIRAKIKKHEDAEDLVQNVFVSFYKAIERFDEKKPVKPYLYQIVSNELKMFYRKYRVLLPLKEELIIEEKNEESFSLSYLKTLTEKEKTILTMVGEGRSYEEIAVEFKKPLNTIKSIIRRARLKARREYEKT